MVQCGPVWSSVVQCGLVTGSDADEERRARAGGGKDDAPAAVQSR